MPEFERVPYLPTREWHSAVQATILCDDTPMQGEAPVPTLIEHSDVEQQHQSCCLSSELPPNLFDGANFPILVKRWCRDIIWQWFDFCPAWSPSPLLAWESGLSDPISKPDRTHPPTRCGGRSHFFQTQFSVFPPPRNRFRLTEVCSQVEPIELLLAMTGKADKVSGQVYLSQWSSWRCPPKSKWSWQWWNWFKLTAGLGELGGVHVVWINTTLHPFPILFKMLETCSNMISI